MQQLDTNQIFAKNIIFLRTKNNMTQLELAEKLNYSDKAVSRWERAEAIPDAKVLIEMSDIFGVSIDNLLKKEIKEKHIRPKFNIHNYNNITWIGRLRCSPLLFFGCAIIRCGLCSSTLCQYHSLCFSFSTLCRVKH